MPKLCNIEFNEANFALISEYILQSKCRKWPNLVKLMDFPSIETSSESDYRLLEPWIQWVSVHTGKTAREHGIFRLGDIAGSNIEQIFDWAEKNGFSVGNIAAINVINRLVKPKYFIPDPWTITRTDGSFFSKAIYEALRQAINDNSSGKLSKKSIFSLALALAVKTKIKNWPLYLKLAVESFRGQKWKKALFLDLFISDLHISYAKKFAPDFTSVFLNGFAHIQHHYFFNSKFYRGNQKNPEWYISEKNDPIEDALDIYDRIFKDHFNEFQNYELVVSTGLRQVPYLQEKYYYRLTDHRSFIHRLGLEFETVHPRMTRDFLIVFADTKKCAAGANLLSRVKLDGHKIFSEIDNRGVTLYVALTYPHKINESDELSLNGNVIGFASQEFVFVAIKNGMHDGIGYSYSSSPSDDFKYLNGKHVSKLHSYFQARLLALKKT